MKTISRSNFRDDLEEIMREESNSKLKIETTIKTK